MKKIDFECKINNKYYNEYYAKFLLEHFYGEVFSNARIMDRPDIWVKNSDGKECIGVEVTTLLDTYYNTLKKYKKAWSKQQKSLEEIVKSMPRILKNKVGINDYGNLVLIRGDNRHTLSKNLTGLEITIKSKLNKLQNYKPIDLINLFIFAPNLAQKFSFQKIFEMIKRIDKNHYSRIFDYIMIFNYDELQIYPYGASGEPEVYPVSDDTRYYCDKLAESEQIKMTNAYNEIQKLKKSRLKTKPKAKKTNAPEKEV